MSSKRAIRRRRCTRKVGHKTRDAAYNAMMRFRDHNSMGIYRCAWCGLWHVGHLPGWLQQKLGR